MPLLHQKNKHFQVGIKYEERALSNKGLFFGLYFKQKAPNSLKVKGFCGPDGTRTRDLRRDRAAF